MQAFILFAILIVAAVAIARAFQRRRRLTVHDPDGRQVTRDIDGGTIRNIGLVFAGVVLALVLFSSVRVVPVGHALVVFNTVTKSFNTARQGVALVVPIITSTALYDLRRLEYTMTANRGEGRRANTDDSIWSPTQEGLQVGIDLTIWHHIDPVRVAEIHQRIGPDFEEKIIRPAVRSVIRLVISEFAVMDVYSAKRASIQTEINQKLRVLLEKDGFMIDEVVLRDVRFTDDFAKAIEQKQIAQQTAEQMKYTLEKEQREAERKVIEANGRAKAIEIINHALAQNPNYIKYLYVDKLSDKISVIVSDQATIMDLKGILDSRK